MNQTVGSLWEPYTLIEFYVKLKLGYGLTE